MTAGGRCGLLVGQAMGWLDESKMDHKMVIFPKGTWKNGMQTNMFGNFGWTLPKNRASFGVIATGFGIWAFSSEAILVTYCNLRNHEQGWLVLMSFESSYNHFWLNVNLVCIGLVVDSEGLILDIYFKTLWKLYTPKVERMEPENYGFPGDDFQVPWSSTSGVGSRHQPTILQIRPLYIFGNKAATVPMDLNIGETKVTNQWLRWVSHHPKPCGFQ